MYSCKSCGRVILDESRPLNSGMASILSKLLGSLSPKRVLVINFDYEYKGVSYIEKLKAELNCTVCKWEDLTFTDGTLTLGEDPISEFSFVVFGTVGDHHVLYSAALACVQAQGVPHFSYGKSEELNSKVLQTVNFRLNKVPHPKTVIVTASKADPDSLIKQLKLPLVVKIIDGSQGKGVTKHETKDSLVKELKAHKDASLIVQEALSSACDYRIFFVYDDLMYVDKRSSTKKSEFRHNISLGGTLEKVDLPADAVAIARAAQKAMGFDASGVDLIQDEPTGKWYVLEVNSAPQFSEPDNVLNKLLTVIKSKL